VVPGGQSDAGTVGTGQYVVGPWPIQKAWLEAWICWRWIGEPERAAITVKGSTGTGLGEEVVEVDAGN